MFLSERKNEDGFEKFILRDTDSKTSATILPGCGAILHSFEVQLYDEPFNVIDSYTSQDDFEKNAESKGFLGSKLSPFVCRLRNGTYRFSEKDYKLYSFYLQKHAIHGLLYRKAFTVIAENADSRSASVTMKYEYRSDDKGYPFSYDCIVTWQLQHGNLLTVTTECINKGKVTIPMQDGWHPYFQLGDKVDGLELEFQSKEMVAFDEDLLPTKKLFEYRQFNSMKKIGDTAFDNCFTLNRHVGKAACILRNAAKKIQVEIWPDNSYPYLQLYIPPHRKSFAIENLSGAPDAFNNGMGVVRLEPGKPVDFKTGYKIALVK
ncbi:MAG TPA: aldose 1-epimerase [Chitinophagaceae bacterium]|nr:aldose 1-epimerase [Chitinophagaceae bacterium]